jgi:D-arabinose 1-dehydrogenase-like Zn-dependent alcohol dehydrogenase
MYQQSCGNCDYCLKGQDIYCYERNIYGEGDFNTGTFGDYCMSSIFLPSAFTWTDNSDVGVETYIHKIPDSLSSEDAAPLQCAGGTVYSALISSTKPGDRVGVLGIGGLGHLAIQFAAKMGFETIVFSTSVNKETEAKSFGASEFYLLSEPEKVVKPINVLIVVGSRYPDWSK